MSKGSRNRNKRKKTFVKEILPVNPADVKDNFSYWVCGYYWDHDMILVEPFCVVKKFKSWEITNLCTHTLEFYQSSQILAGKGTMLIFEDRVTALDAVEAIENQNILLESFVSYMNEEQLIEYLNGKRER